MIKPNTTLRFMRREQHTVYKETPYKLRKDIRRFGWLADLCWRLLHKLNALEMYSEKVTTWRYSEVQQRKLTEMVMTMREELFEYFEDPDNWVVVVGAYDFQEVMQSPMLMSHTVFEAGPIASKPHYFRLVGVDVHVVPWLRGMAVLPRVVIETRKGGAA
ncbi:hypothetical protein ASD54_12555 [Rhizobium sp. Root149]|uniref:hypothetical protein n=1 Tax=Rhizobium sp. Root149 TaxID=1736473 RepID=UPI0007137E39|nr:hypothetical protein [Rhizobium sp. Root149]KQZ49761.1 hypothetical protein ASD54_12555 [Rhizobium sp. Root149]